MMPISQRIGNALWTKRPVCRRNRSFRFLDARSVSVNEAKNDDSARFTRCKRYFRRHCHSRYYNRKLLQNLCSRYYDQNAHDMQSSGCFESDAFDSLDPCSALLNDRFILCDQRWSRFLSDWNNVCLANADLPLSTKKSSERHLVWWTSAAFLHETTAAEKPCI